MTLQRIVIVDLDGTIADNSARDPYAYQLAAWDKPIERIIELVAVLHAAGYEIVYLTGRQGWSRPHAQGWLDQQPTLPPGPLFMRATGDERPDAVVKSELLEQYLDEGRVAFVIDDRASVVEMWRARGLTVLDVAGHTF